MLGLHPFAIIIQSDTVLRANSLVTTLTVKTCFNILLKRLSQAVLKTNSSSLLSNLQGPSCRVGKGFTTSSTSVKAFRKVVGSTSTLTSGFHPHI